jgi:Zn-dependent peptidase ImmA (M78 family)/DNA-binding XRE family transcriptional regulator
MFPDRLRLARKRAGLSMQALAERLSPPVTAQAIGKYETGRMMPSSAVLVGLGKALDVSLDFLMGGQVTALSGVEFRKHSGTSARDRGQAEALVIESLEDYLAVEEVLDIEQPVDPFADVRAAHVSSALAIEDKARELRELWQLGIDPIPSLTDLLEEKGVKVIVIDLPERFDGLACTVERSGGRPSCDAVVISQRSNVERKRFNLAHELAHRVILSVAPDSGLKHERAMHRFAAAFLAPREHLEQEVGAGRQGITWHELIRLKQYYGMSASAMLIRLRDVGLLPEATVSRAFRTFARAWRTAEPEPIADDEGLGAFEKPRRFERLARSPRI